MKALEIAEKFQRASDLLDDVMSDGGAVNFLDAISLDICEIQEALACVDGAVETMRSKLEHITKAFEETLEVGAHHANQTLEVLRPERILKVVLPGERLQVVVTKGEISVAIRDGRGTRLEHGVEGRIEPWTRARRCWRYADWQRIDIKFLLAALVVVCMQNFNGRESVRGMHGNHPKKYGTQIECRGEEA